MLREILPAVASGAPVERDLRAAAKREVDRAADGVPGAFGPFPGSLEAWQHGLKALKEEASGRRTGRWRP